jgi:hypothetical protein
MGTFSSNGGESVLTDKVVVENVRGGAVRLQEVSGSLMKHYMSYDGYRFTAPMIQRLGT